MEPEKLLDELSAYYFGLGKEGRGVLKTFAWMMFLALLTNLASRLPAKKDEDHLKVVLAEPVGVWADRQRMKTVTQPQVKTEPRTRSEKLTLSASKALRKLSIPPFKVKIPVRLKTATAYPPPIGQKTPDMSKSTLGGRNGASETEPFDHPPCMPANAVAEIDFIRAAERRDIIALKAAFGTVHVPSDSYDESARLLEALGLEAADYLARVPPGADGSPYPSVDAAKRLRAVVLSDSPNLGRICEAGGIATWTSRQWRLLAPKPC
ncbi:MAG: hypothetical protein V1875_06025 [Candidatus Altiarchaeota archaeon]